MFIPKGKTLHENLATSYVMVDALVADLCDGGFSGVVEIGLRKADGYIVIERGTVAVVVESRGEDGPSRTTIEDMVARSRRERGRISVYSHSPGAIGAIAGFLTSEPLYTRLSAEFADMERLIHKLSREPNRQWFIQVDPGRANGALIHIKEGLCRIIKPDDGIESEAGALDPAENPALRDLLDRCNREGTAFDVYLKGPEQAAPAEPMPDTEHSQESVQLHAQPEATQEEKAASAPQEEAHAADFSAVTEDAVSAVKSGDAEQAMPIEPADELHQEILRDEGAEDQDKREMLARMWSSVLPEAVSSDEPQIAELPVADATPEQSQESRPFRVRPMETSDLGLAREAVMMNELKQLMGEIILTVEEAARAVEMKESFTINLRAGQLKVADRFPFLDPFGGEFEYLAGEIAFVGEANPLEFIEAITEALRLTISELIESASHPTHLRAIIAEDLHKLSNRRREKFERLALDQMIARIINP